jgi:hypothetical protein
MSVRKTAAKFDVNPSTVQRIARPFDDAHRTLCNAGLTQADLLHRKHIAHLTTPTQGGLSDFENKL